MHVREEEQACDRKILILCFDEVLPFSSTLTGTDDTKFGCDFMVMYGTHKLCRGQICPGWSYEGTFTIKISSIVWTDFLNAQTNTEATVSHRDRMNEGASLTDEGDLLTLWLLWLPEKRPVKHCVTRPRGLLWKAWEDFSYDLAPQTANKWKKMS